MHASTVSEPAGDVRPLAQATQADATVARVPSTAVRYVSAAHALHAYCCCMSLYLPDEHSSHVPAPTDEIFPSTQFAQLIAGVEGEPVTKVPRLQSAHVG